MREGLMDDTGYNEFDECCRYEECCSEAYEKGVADGREEAIDEFEKRLLADLIPMRDKKFDIAKGTEMPERYTHLKVMDTLDMIIEMVKIRAEQLKEKKNETA